MGDFAEGDYLRMVCVESANAGEDVVTLEPGEEHRLMGAVFGGAVEVNRGSGL